MSGSRSWRRYVDAGAALRAYVAPVQEARTDRRNAAEAALASPRRRLETEEWQLSDGDPLP